jgi:competence protein ComEC
MPPLVLAAVAWGAGLIVAHHWLVPLGVKPQPLFLLCLLPVAAILLWPKDRSMRLSSACALALLGGALRYWAAIPDLDDPVLVAHYNDCGWVTLEGVVRGYPDVRDTWTNLRLGVESIELEGEAYPVHGTVLVRAARYPEYRYGDRLRVSGLLETPPVSEDFSYRDYLAGQGIYSFVGHPQTEWLASGQGSPLWTAIFALKDRARAVIAGLVPDPEASLLQGIVLGIETGIPAGLYDDYNATGTSHIIVISGANITLIAALFSRTLGRVVGRRRAYWFTLASVILYVLLVGADAVVVRAGVMGALYLTARHLGRRATAYVSLFASLLFLTLINPLALWNVGFQLSFAATLGLALFTPAIERLFERALTRFVPPERARQVIRTLNDAVVVSLAAQALTTPLVVYHFGRLSLVAPLTNLLILPIQPPIMALGGLATVAGLVPILEPAARVVAWLPWLGLAYTNAVVRTMADWRFASVSIGRASASVLLLYYGLLLGGIWLWQKRDGTHGRAWAWVKSLPTRWSTTGVLGLLLAAAILACLAVVQLPDGRLHVSFLDVGQGDAILITAPQGQQILVDGGPSPSALTSALGQEMAFWDRSLDVVVMTHPDGDHVAGLLEVLDRYRVGQWLDNGRPGDDAVYAECQALLEGATATRHVVRAGDRLELGQNVVLEVLHPSLEPISGPDGEDNDHSVVLRLIWAGASFLLTGDVGAEAERLLLESGQPLSAAVLKVAHHGSGASSTDPFLAAVAPRYAVIPVGADNRFGHPKREVLDRLARSGDVTVLRTDESGTIEFITDGQRLWVQTER